MTKTQTAFIDQSRAKHGDRYDYSRVVYRGARQAVTIFCPDHGSFQQRPDSHLAGQGCSQCGRIRSARQRATWSAFDVQHLRDNYVSKGAIVCAGVLGKSVTGTRSKASYLGITHVQRCQLPLGGIPKRVWSRICSNAKARGLKVQVIPSQLWDLYQGQNGRCALTGWSISLEQGAITASLDRIDSSKGYVEGNVQWVHKRANVAKLNLPEVEFYALCKAISIHRHNDFERWERTEEVDLLNDTIKVGRRRMPGIPDLEPDFSEEALFGT